MTTDQPSAPESGPWTSPSPGPAPDPSFVPAPGPAGSSPLPLHLTPPPAPGARRAGLTALVVVGSLVVALCGVSAAGVVALFALQPDRGGPAAAPPQSVSPTPSPQRALAKDDCVSGSTREYVLEPCPRGTHTIVSTATDFTMCPVDTDVLGEDTDGRVVCLVSHLAPHPGAPGAGGGIIRIGDCLPNVDVDGLVEVPCAAGRAFHRIVGMAASHEGCKAPAVRTMSWDGMLIDSHRTLCLADGRAKVSPGKCVAWAKAPTEVAVPCTTRPALKLLGRVSDISKCERWGAVWYMPRYDNLSWALFECYRKLG